jgi:cystathionine gamma-lyase
VSDREGGLRPGTRAVHGGLPAARVGEPFLPGPVPASAVHLAGEADPAGYGRFANPTWAGYEAALGDLEGGEAVAYASGMAAVSAVLLALLRPGEVLVYVEDAYPGVRTIAREHLEPRGVVVRGVPTDDAALRAALPGARMVWVESPSNPELRVLDLPGLAAAAQQAGALLAVDGTLATPLRQRPLELGAALSVASGTKALTGHSDLLIGHVAARDPELVAVLRSWRTLTGGIPGPFETWLAHRSLATLGVRVERQEANAQALAGLLADHPAVLGGRWPGVGCVVAFELPDAARAQAFIDACGLVADATSFGGVHSSAERRARWGTDAVGEGFIRFSCGVEDTADLLADVAQALDAVAG